METISIGDGLVLTVVSMLVVFIVLSSIWGLVEFVSKFVNKQEPVPEIDLTGSTKKEQVPSNLLAPDTLTPKEKHQQVAELMALVLASEDEPNKKFEIIESKRVK